MTVDLKKILILNLPYLLFVYLFDKLCQAVRLAPGLDASEKFLHLSQGFTEAFSSGLPSLHPLDLLVGIAGAVIVRLAVYTKGKNARKYRRGIEYGSARWGTAADIAPYSKKFREEHEEEILLHQAAKNAFDEMGVKKLPKVKELQTEYAKLLEEKKKTYAEYRRSREEMRELLTAKANVDRVLKMEVEQDVEKEKDHGQR